MTTQSKQAQPARSYRQYEELWLKIASGDHADKGVPIKCHPRAAKRIIQAVRKEKAIANKTRKDLQLPRYGEMNSVIEYTDDGRARILFSLQYNGDLL